MWQTRRERAGWPRPWLAKALGVPLKVLAAIEAGHVHPTEAQRRALERLLVQP